LFTLISHPHVAQDSAKALPSDEDDEEGEEVTQVFDGIDKNQALDNDNVCCPLQSLLL
jgi:hypothetical protein